jgi:hypothetical protein
VEITRRFQKGIRLRKKMEDYEFGFAQLENDVYMIY